MANTEFWILTAGVAGFLLAVLIFVPKKARWLAASSVLLAYGVVLAYSDEWLLAAVAAGLAVWVIVAKLRR